MVQDYTQRAILLATATAALVLNPASAQCATEVDSTEAKVKEILHSYEALLTQDPDNVRLLYALGTAYYSRRNYERAQVLFEKALKLDPSDQKVKTSLGLTYLFLNQFDKSKKLLEDVLKEEPQNPQVLIGLGRLAQLNYHFEDAEKYYVEALKFDPSNRSALSFLASLRMEQKRYPDAAEIYDKLLPGGPAWVKRELEKAKLGRQLDEISLMELNGNKEEAVKKYLALIASNPNIIELYLFLGRLYIQDHQYDEAIALYNRGLQTNPNANDLRTAIGMAYLAQKNFVKSREMLKNALSFNPKDAEAYAGLGRIAALSNRPEEAKEYYQKALDAAPYNTTALTWYAELLQSQKQFLEAENLYKRLLQKEPNADWAETGVLQTRFGTILDEIKKREDKKEYSAAERLYRKLISVAPAQEPFYLGLGHLYMVRKQYDKAIETYTAGLKVEAESIPLQVALANAYLFSNNLNKSYKLFQLVLQRDPNNADALAGSGRVAALEGYAEEAEILYRKALKSDHDNLTALSYLGQLKMEQHKYKEAQRVFAAIVGLRPHEEWAIAALENAKNGPVLEKIKAYEEKDQFDNAESLFLQLIAESPHNPDYYSGLGRLYLEHKQAEDALEIYLEGMSVLPDSISVKIGLGYAYLANNEMNKAAHVFREALEKEPENGDALAGIGRVAEAQGKSKEAETLYQRALEFNENNISALSSLGSLYLKEGKYNQAETIYRKLHGLIPEASWVTYALQDIKFAPLLEEINTLQQVDTLSEQDKLLHRQTAEKLLRRLLRRAPHNPDYYHRLGLLYAQMRRFPEAIEIYQKGLSIDPSSNPIKNSLGFAYIYSEDYKNAEKVFQSVRDSDPENAEALAGLGRVEDLTGHQKEADNAYRSALEIDPYNITALAFMGALKMKEEQFDQAQEIFQRLRTLQPTAGWVTKAIEDAQVGPMLAQIKQFEESEQIEQAEALFLQILSQVIDTADYYLAFGNLYIRQYRYPQAIKIFQQGLDKNPDSNQLRAALGIAYVHNGDPDNAKWVLDEANAITPDNAEILAGLGRVEALQRNFREAEKYYAAAMTVGPDNVSVLSFYGDMLMQERHYDEAHEIYERLLELDPNASWVRRALKSAQCGSYADSAKLLQDLEDFHDAECRYWNLIGCASDNPDYYLYLGELYAQMERYDDAIEVLRRGLIIDPNALHLWRALGYIYIADEKYYCARKIFLHLLSRDPEDAYAWAGLGRLQAICGNFCRSEEYYARSLSLSPRNETAINYLALGRTEQERFFDARRLYCRLMWLLPEEKWVRDNYKFVCRQTRPIWRTLGGYHEEREWDQNTKEWVARYQVYGVDSWITTPMSNCFWFTGFGGDNYYKLTNTEDEFIIYSFQVARARLAIKWHFAPNYYIDASMGMSTYWPQHRGQFTQGNGIIPEPTLLLNYRTHCTEATFGFASETDLVARNFNSIHAKMVGRYFLYGRYQRELMRNFYTGIEGDYSWYHDYVDNKSQFARVWALWRPEELWELLMFRYVFQYEAFDKVIPDYYTFAPQLIHRLQVELSNTWRDIAYFSIGYAHGWQRTRTRFNQIVVGIPVVRGPFFNDIREYNEYYGSAGFNHDCFSIDLKGDYQRQTHRYTIWNVFLTLGWRF